MTTNQTATITVKYVNPPKPGKKRGTIKDESDTFYGVWPDKIALFQQGRTYAIEYTSQEANGQTWHTIVSAVQQAEVAPAAAAAKQATGGGGQVYRETCAKDAERMFVCSMMNAFIQAGKLDLEGTKMVNATRMMRRVWQHTFGESVDSSALAS